MPSLSQYKKQLGSHTNGEARKIQSDMLMLNTWEQDIQSKVSHISYIYDYYHDDEPLIYKGMHPENSKTKCPIDLKFIVNSYNSEAKDIVGFHIQFKPFWDWHTESKLSYYKDVFEDKYEAEFPIGMYLDIWDDEIKMYRKWLITEPANTLGNQFPTWYILPIDHIFQWIHKGNKYQMCGVSRSQSSYNSGIWLNYKIEEQENQRKCVLPMNDISTTIYYNTRIIISAPIETPISWKCSKVEQTSPKGSNRLTFAQEEWDQHNDAFEYIDGTITREFYSDKKVVGMYADYFKSEILPTEPSEIPTVNIRGEFTYSSLPQLKVGGGYKKLTLKFYKDKEEIELPDGNYYFYIDDSDANNMITTIVDGNIIKVKFDGDDSWIGKILKIEYRTDNNISTFVELEIVGL